MRCQELTEEMNAATVERGEMSSRLSKETDSKTHILDERINEQSQRIVDLEMVSCFIRNMDHIVHRIKGRSLIRFLCSFKIVPVNWCCV